MRISVSRPEDQKHLRIYANWWNPDLLPRGGNWHNDARKLGLLRHEEIKELRVFDSVIVDASGIYQYDPKYFPLQGLVYRVKQKWPHLVLTNPDSPTKILTIISLSHIDSYSVLNPMIQRVGTPYVHYITLRPTPKQITRVGLRSLAELELTTSVKLDKAISRIRRPLSKVHHKNLGNKKA